MRVDAVFYLAPGLAWLPRSRPAVAALECRTTVVFRRAHLETSYHKFYTVRNSGLAAHRALPPGSLTPDRPLCYDEAAFFGSRWAAVRSQLELP